jgi:hypothetical protein
MKTLILAAALISTGAFAGGPRDVSLTDSCEETLKDFALKAEYGYLATKGETLASTLDATVYLSYWPAKDDASVTVHVEDAADGRHVRYLAKFLKANADACDMQLKRADNSYCRYSTDDGPDGLNEISALKFEAGEKISADTKLTKLATAQVKAFLGQNSPYDTVKELIEGTDDGELSTGTLSLPNGKTLTYLGAYGGDNPFGIFFEKGTTKTAGENSDGSVCIK